MPIGIFVSGYETGECVSTVLLQTILWLLQVFMQAILYKYVDFITVHEKCVVRCTRIINIACAVLESSCIFDLAAFVTSAILPMDMRDWTQIFARIREELTSNSMDWYKYSITMHFMWFDH